MRNTWDRKELLVELCASSKPLTPANMFEVGGKGNVQLQHVTNLDMRTFSTSLQDDEENKTAEYIFIILTPVLLFKMQLSNKMITEAHHCMAEWNCVFTLLDESMCRGGGHPRAWGLCGTVGHVGRWFGAVS